MGYKRRKSGVFAYLSSPTTTTVTTAGTFTPIQGTFVNSPIEDFTIVGGTLVCNKAGVYEIDWNSAFKADANGTTVYLGIAINSEVLTTSNPSVMSIYCKTLNETFPLGGTDVLTLKEDDVVSLELTSDGDGDVITVQQYTTTIARFYR